MELISVYIPKNHVEKLTAIEENSEDTNRSHLIRKAVREFLEKFNKEN